MAKYEIIGGSHHVGGKTYKQGEVLEMEQDPRKRWRNKFRLVSDMPATVANADQPGNPENKEEDKAPAVTGAGDLGEDKTERFDDAVENELAVYKKGKLYHVYDPDDTSEPLNTEEELSNMGEVEAWLKSYVSDD